MLLSTVVSDVSCAVRATASVRQCASVQRAKNTYRQPEPGAPVNSGDGMASLRWMACDRAVVLVLAVQLIAQRSWPKFAVAMAVGHVMARFVSVDWRW
jgi:hypothetical protein